LTCHYAERLSVKHRSVLRSLAQTLDEFDQVVEQGTDAARAHISASAELDAAAEELVQVVRLMDGLNHYRFADDADSLAGWESASNVVGLPSSGGQGIPSDTPPSGGEIKPAA
jgi:hypothetical protein